MGNPFAGIGAWRGRQWAGAGVFALSAVCVAVLIGPQLWAAYHYRAGVSALERYHSTEALGHFRACLTVWSKNISARVYASRAARRLGDYAEARNHLKECQRLLRGTSPDVALEDALLRTTMGELNAFEGSLRTRMEREPQNAALILEALAEGYARMCRIIECMICLSQWLELDPKNVQALFLRGRSSQQIPAFEKAVADYRLVLELDPDRLEARERLVVCLVEISRFEEALGHLKYLERLGPYDPDMQVRIARCHQGMGQTRTSRKLLEAVLEENPDHAQALLLLGRINLSAGETEEAEACLRRAAEVLPADFQAQWQLYDCLNRQEGKSAEAQVQLAITEKLRQLHLRLTEISRKLTIRPHDASLQYEMGSLLIQMGNKDLGANWLSSALQEKPDYPEARDALIAYLEEMGRTDDAEQLRQEALAIPSSGQKR
jgi:tetratricopeptide (TPR) repeat protein